MQSPVITQQTTRGPCSVLTSLKKYFGAQPLPSNSDHQAVSLLGDADWTFLCFFGGEVARNVFTLQYPLANYFPRQVTGASLKIHSAPLTIASNLQRRWWNSASAWRHDSVVPVGMVAQHGFPRRLQKGEVWLEPTEKILYLSRYYEKLEIWLKYIHHLTRCPIIINGLLHE